MGFDLEKNRVTPFEQCFLLMAWEMAILATPAGVGSDGQGDHNRGQEIELARTEVSRTSGNASILRCGTRKKISVCVSCVDLEGWPFHKDRKEAIRGPGGVGGITGGEQTTAAVLVGPEGSIGTLTCQGPGACGPPSSTALLARG